MPENKSRVRYEAEDDDIRDNLFETYSGLVRQHCSTPSQIFNVDETDLQMVTKNPKILTTVGDNGVHVKKKRWVREVKQSVLKYV